MVHYYAVVVWLRRSCDVKSLEFNFQVRLYPEMLCAGYKAGGKVTTTFHFYIYVYHCHNNIIIVVIIIK